MKLSLLALALLLTLSSVGCKSSPNPETQASPSVGETGNWVGEDGCEISTRNKRNFGIWNSSSAPFVYEAFEDTSTNTRGVRIAVNVPYDNAIHLFYDGATPIDLSESGTGHPKHMKASDYIIDTYWSTNSPSKAHLRVSSRGSNPPPLYDKELSTQTVTRAPGQSSAFLGITRENLGTQPARWKVTTRHEGVEVYFYLETPKKP